MIIDEDGVENTVSIDRVTFDPAIEGSKTNVGVKVDTSNTGGHDEASPVGADAMKGGTTNAGVIVVTPVDTTTPRPWRKE